MSARNYTDCPACRDNARKLRAKLEQEADDDYGKVSRDKFDEMVRSAKEVTANLGSLAEYYEWDFTTSKKWQMRYSCYCRDCGFEFKHNTEALFTLN